MTNRTPIFIRTDAGEAIIPGQGSAIANFHIVLICAVTFRIHDFVL